MKLKRNGVTVEITDPPAVERMLRGGWKEVKAVEPEPKAKKPKGGKAEPEPEPEADTPAE